MFSLYNHIIFQCHFGWILHCMSLCLLVIINFFWLCKCSSYLFIFVFLASRLESYIASLCSMMLTDHISSSLVCQLGRGYKTYQKAAKSGLQERTQHVCLVTRVWILRGFHFFGLRLHLDFKDVLFLPLIFCFHSSVLSQIIKMVLIVLKTHFWSLGILFGTFCFVMDWFV